MYFIFVLVICLLSLSTLFKDKCYSLDEYIYSIYIYRHSEIFINNSIRISFSKTPALHFSCLAWFMYTQKIEIVDLAVTHHLGCLSSSFLQVMSQ